MATWRTVAPIDQRWVPQDGVTLPFEFEPGLCLDHIPEWIRTDQIIESLTWDNRDAIRNRAHYCLFAEYEATIGGEPDPEFTGDETRSKQASAYDRIAHANQALWLARPSALGYAVLIDVSQSDSDWSLRSTGSLPRLAARSADETARHSQADLELAHALYGKIRSLSRTSSVWLSRRSLWSALTALSPEIRYMRGRIPHSGRVVRVVDPGWKVSKAGSCATGACEPRQVRKEAAVSNASRVPRGCLA